MGKERGPGKNPGEQGANLMLIEDARAEVDFADAITPPDDKTTDDFSDDDATADGPRILDVTGRPVEAEVGDLFVLKVSGGSQMPVPPPLASIVPAEAPRSSTAATHGGRPLPEAFASPNIHTADTAVPLGERVKIVMGLGQGPKSTPTGFTEEGGSVHQLPKNRPKKRGGGRSFVTGALMGSVAFAVAGVYGVSKLQENPPQPDSGQQPKPNLADLLKEKEIETVEVPVLEEDEGVKEIREALTLSKNGILVVICGEKPGQLSTSDEVLLYAKGGEEAQWSEVQWAVPWEQVQGFDAFPQPLREYCHETNAGQRSIVTLSKPSQE